MHAINVFANLHRLFDAQEIKRVLVGNESDAFECHIETLRYFAVYLRNLARQIGRRHG